MLIRHGNPANSDHVCYASANEMCCASSWHTGVQCCQPFKSTLMNLAQSKKEPRDKSSDFLSRLSHAQYGSLCLMDRRVEKSETVDSSPVCKAWPGRVCTSLRSHKLVTDQHCSQQPITDQHCSERPITDQHCSKQPITDQHWFKQLITDQHC